MIEHRLFTDSNARGYTPMECDDGDGQPGVHGYLAQTSTGDWSWKPWRYADGNGRGAYRFFVTGPRCTCTLNQPVGTRCERHAPRELAQTDTLLQAA